MTKKQGPPAESPTEPPEGVTPPHWHYATSLMGGYSPDAEQFPSVTNAFDLAGELAQELGEAEEFLREGMDLCAEEGDAGELLKEYKRLQVVEKAANYLSNVARQRKMAFWADKQVELADRVLGYVETYFPLAISHNSELETWRCRAGQDCEHWKADE